jgi:hypothetical protein
MRVRARRGARSLWPSPPWPTGRHPRCSGFRGWSRSVPPLAAFGPPDSCLRCAQAVPGLDARRGPSAPMARRVAGGTSYATPGRRSPTGKRRLGPAHATSPITSSAPLSFCPSVLLSFCPLPSALCASPLPLSRLTRAPLTPSALCPSAPLHLSLAETARRLAVSTAKIAKAVASAEQPGVQVNHVPQHIGSEHLGSKSLGGVRRAGGVREVRESVLEPTPHTRTIDEEVVR